MILLFLTTALAFADVAPPGPDCRCSVAGPAALPLLLVALAPALLRRRR